jgi:hypothetical protein
MIGVACNLQIPQANLHVVLNVKSCCHCFTHIGLKVSSVLVVQNEQSNPEITFKVIKQSLLAFLNMSQKVTDYLLQ